MSRLHSPSLRAYRTALFHYIGHDDERGLARAYELGRAAMKNGRGILELLELHSKAAIPLLTSLSSLAQMKKRIRACNKFLAEVLAPFEMRRL